MGLFTDAFPGTSNTASSIAEMPAWYQQFLQGMSGQGAALAGTPSPTYEGQRIAGFNPDQQQAFGIARAGAGNWQPQLNQAGALTTASSQYEPSKFNQFLSPYIGGVVDEIGRLGTRNLQEKILPGVMDTFTGAGQFGSKRNMDFAGRAIRDTSRDIAGQQAGALQSAYDQAAKQYGDWSNRGLYGANQMGQLGQMGQMLNLRDVGALTSVGNQQQGQQQQNLDWAYQQFQQQANDPWTRLNNMSALMRGYNIPSSSTTVSTGMAPMQSFGQQSLGALTQLAGLFT